MVCYIKKPKFCPNCAQRLTNFPEKIKNRNAILPCVNTYGKSLPEPHLVSSDELDWVFDCYCHGCGWSGDIRPDIIDEDLEGRKQ